MEEIWKDLPFHPGYQISNFGRVKSVHRVLIRKDGKPCTVKEKICKPSKDGKGYLFIRASVYKEKSSIRIHRWVALLFVPNPDNKKEVNHEDGNKENNFWWNFKWVTPSENVKHAFRIGIKSHNGSKHPKSKLTEDQVIEMKNLFKKSELTAKQIGKLFGVGFQCVNQIKYGINWSHVKI